MIIRPPVIKRLFARSGNQCAFPTCRPPSWKVKPSWARFATSQARAHTAPAMTPARPTNSRSWETVSRTSILGFRVTREINSIEANGVDQFAFMWPTHADCHRSRARPHWWPTNFMRVSICHAGALARADKGMSERVGGVPRVDDLQLLPNDPIEALGAHLRRRSGNAASGIFRPAKLTGLKTGARHRASGCSRHENQEFRQCRPPAASNPAAAFTICNKR